MTTPAALDDRAALPPVRRAAALAAVGLARPLTLLPPHRLRTVLTLLRRGAAPAGHAHAAAARQAVTTVSLTCLGPQGCLPRSLATVLLCRMAGRWPTWCVGVRVTPPFGAHAWVEAEGRLVGEGVPEGYFTTLITVPPHPGASPR
ncbi:hypothetical protein GCM10009678_22530 [Actinomadura kijaniata]|uniref:Microcin J25-processing protein McjB C-terminal domain-containing protein n=1 Tax=Actinomadura namibiensis TaxID=182080 RepID=A0A7W3LN44_ACTNM|nr:lasso peptide biosynthesis B2 protein [Actinomadura namibiensis]MBA8951157.1 hypothetical protein [Actinomadura namibiensis]